MPRPFVALACVALLGTAAPAQSLRYFNFTGDATSQISGTKTYTSAVDFGGTTSSAAGGAVINGKTFARIGSDVGTGTVSNVRFADGTGLAAASGVSTAGGATPFGTVGITNTADGTYALMNDFLYSASAPTARTLTVGGLTSGQRYSLRLYARPWGDSAYPDRNTAITFSNSGGGTLNLREDNVAASVSTVPNSASAAGLTRNQAYAVVYDYTATAASFTVSFAPADPAATFHFYGLTNELAPVPEPAAVGLLAAAGLGLGRLARRRR